jgi:hypothetical protein
MSSRSLIDDDPKHDIDEEIDQSSMFGGRSQRDCSPDAKSDESGGQLETCAWHENFNRPRRHSES